MLVYCIGAITVLLCFCGLALDLGTFELTRMRMQNAADAAALGAVVAGQSGGSMSAAGLQDAAQNGFTSGVGNVAVTVNNPPGTGAYAGNASAAQATITDQVSGSFLPGKFKLTTKATALGTPPSCVYLLSQSASGAALTGVNETLNAACPFYLGSSYNFNGGSGSSGSQFYVAGSSSASVGSVTPQAVFGSRVQADPLASVPAPTIGGCSYVKASITAAATLSPGTYCGGLSINTKATVTLQPGVYVILGALSVTNANLYGSGITFYLSQGNGYAYAASTMSSVSGSLSAPTTGSLQGLLVFADRTLPAGGATFTVQYFSAATTLDGILYLPGQEILASGTTLQGKNYFGLVANSLHINNTNFAPSTNYSSLAGGNPFQAAGSVGLVE